MVSDRDIYLTADGRPVEEDAPDHAFLLVAKGGKLPSEQARKFGISQADDDTLTYEGYVPPAPDATEGEPATGETAQAEGDASPPNSEPAKEEAPAPAETPKAKRGR
jgi:hypothetical protein